MTKCIFTLSFAAKFEETGAVSLKTLGRDTKGSPHSLPKGRVLWGTLGALVTLVALVVLVACPAANNRGGGTGQLYVCDNGTPSSLRDATADGISRCVSCSPIATLDGTADSIGSTCQFSVEVGEAARIGMAMQFGESEGTPYDLAAIGSTLYMLGVSTVTLYTLDTTTGRATQVGSAADFGVSERFPTGLAAIGTTLYMVGSINDVLYTLSTTTGVATQESDASVDEFGVGENGPQGLAAIGGTLYMVGRDTDALYTLNIDSADMTPDGRAIQVGNATNFGVIESQPSGLAAIGGTLYMVGLTNDVLYTLNTTTGGAIQVGSATAGFGVGEGFPTGLAAIGSTLYMVGTNTEALYALRYQ